jgi:hypothetical protein
MWVASGWTRRFFFVAFVHVSYGVRVLAENVFEIEHEVVPDRMTGVP